MYFLLIVQYVTPIVQYVCASLWRSCHLPTPSCPSVLSVCTTCERCAERKGDLRRHLLSTQYTMSDSAPVQLSVRDLARDIITGRTQRKTEERNAGIKDIEIIQNMFRSQETSILEVKIREQKTCTYIQVISLRFVFILQEK